MLNQETIYESDPQREEGKRTTMEAILGQLRAMQAYETDSDSELKGLLDDLRRGILFINAQQLPQMSADLWKTLTAGSDLELTVPLIPFLVEYKIDLSDAAGLDLRQIWEQMQACLGKHKL